MMETLHPGKEVALLGTCLLLKRWWLWQSSLPHNKIGPLPAIGLIQVRNSSTNTSAQVADSPAVLPRVASYQNPIGI